MNKIVLSMLVLVSPIWAMHVDKSKIKRKTIRVEVGISAESAQSFSVSKRNKKAKKSLVRDKDGNRVIFIYRVK